MPAFIKGGAARTPFGRNQWLYSTKDVKTYPATFSMTGIPSETIDGNTEKVLQPGTVLAKITAVGAEQDKVGVFDTTAADGRQTSANIVGICNTFVPWELLERDAEVAVAYEAAAKFAWCFQYTAGVRAALTTTIRDAMVALPALAITFR